jgi:site-specific DNA recombinase
MRTEVLKGIEERCRQGWQHGLASYGYMNCSDERDEPIRPHPQNSKAVVRAFELYASGRHTFESLADQLAGEGYTYQTSNPRFHRTALSRMLRNRVYIGEIKWGERYFTGKHRPLVDRRTFSQCQDLLDGKIRRTTTQINMPLAGGLFTCQHCGALITGERIKRKLKGGGVRPHDYYRCANNYPDENHPSVRWRGDDLEDAIVADLETIRIPDGELADWFNRALQAAFKNTSEVQRQQRLALKKRAAEIEAMQERSLTAYLAGTIDESTLASKQTQLRDESASVAATLATCGEVDAEDVRTALGVFQFAQNAAQIWRGSKMDQKREILDAVSLNRMLGDVSLVVEKRRPFDELAKRPSVTSSRDDRI